MTAYCLKYKRGSQKLGGVLHNRPAANDQGPTDSPDFRQLEGLYNNFGTDPRGITHGNGKKRFEMLRGRHVWVTGAVVVWREKFCAGKEFWHWHTSAAQGR